MICYSNTTNKNLDRPIFGKYSEKSIYLSSNLPYDRHIVEHATSLLKSCTLHNYANPLPIYSAIAAYHRVNMENITIGFGATEIIDRILKTIAIPHLYIATPAFEMVEVYCAIYAIPYSKISMSDVRNLPSNSYLYISNPNGHTGELFDILPYLDNFALVINDEVYADFADYSLIDHSFKNVITIKSFAKTLGLAGLRVGYAVTTATIGEMLNKTRLNHVCTSISVQLIPSLIYKQQKVINRLLHTRNYLESTYTTKPSKANYVLFKQPNHLTDKFGSRFTDGHYRMALAEYYTHTS